MLPTNPNLFYKAVHIRTYIIYLLISYFNKLKKVSGHKTAIKNPGSEEQKAGTRLSRHCGGMKLKGIEHEDISKDHM